MPGSGSGSSGLPDDLSENRGAHQHSPYRSTQETP